MLWKFFLLSVDTGIRCEWLLDLHAAFKAKGREKRTHNLHYSWVTEDKGHSSVVCLPPSPASRESVFETTTLCWFLDQNPQNSEMVALKRHSIIFQITLKKPDADRMNETA